MKSLPFRVALLFGIWLVGAFTGGCSRAAPPAAEEEQPQAPVAAEPARPLVLPEWTQLLGTTVPLPGHGARISAAVEGRVLSVLADGQGAAVHEGQDVKAGDVLAQIDPRQIARGRADDVALPCCCPHVSFGCWLDGGTST